MNSVPLFNNILKICKDNFASEPFIFWSYMILIGKFNVIFIRIYPEFAFFCCFLTMNVDRFVSLI